jgi:hypothetical protein
MDDPVTDRIGFRMDYHACGVTMPLREELERHGEFFFRWRRVQRKKTTESLFVA